MKNVLALAIALGVLSFFSVSFLAQATDLPHTGTTMAASEETIAVIEEISDSEGLIAACTEAVDASFDGENPSAEDYEEAMRLCIESMVEAGVE